MSVRLPSPEQRFEFLARLGARINWNNFSSEEIQLLMKDIPIVGPKVEQVLEEYCRKRSSERLQINRTEPLKPSLLISREGWEIDRQEERSLALTSINPWMIQLLSTLEKGENYVRGGEHSKRLEKTGHIPLDAKVLYALLQKRYLIPDAWKKTVRGNPSVIGFEGTMFRAGDSSSWFLGLFWLDASWRQQLFAAEDARDFNYFSAVLEVE